MRVARPRPTCPTGLPRRAGRWRNTLALSKAAAQSPGSPVGQGLSQGPPTAGENSPDGGERAFTGVRWAAPQAEPPLQGGGERSISKLDHRRHQKTPASESVKKLHSIPQVQVTPAQGDEQTWYLPSCTRRLEMPGAGTRGKHQLTLNRKTAGRTPCLDSRAICCQGIRCW